MWRYVKIPKAIALLAFLLPWMTVSCSDRKMADANGWQLMIGRPALTDAARMAGLPSELPVSYFLVAAFALIAIGLILSLLRKRMAIAVVATSLGGLALIWAGANQYTSERIALAVAKAKRDGDIDQVAASLFHVDWQIGYWVALGALAVAALLAFLAIRDPDTR